MNTSQSKRCVPYFHIRTCAFLSRSHAPESCRGDDDTTGNTQPSRKYFGGSGRDRFFDRDGYLTMDFLVLFATEFHIVKFEEIKRTVKIS